MKFHPEILWAYSQLLAISNWLSPTGLARNLMLSKLCKRGSFTTVENVWALCKLRNAGGINYKQFGT